MTVYVDNANIMWKGKKRFHMVADSLYELHSFCLIHNINKCWFDNHPRHPHYDITEAQRTLLLPYVKVISSKELLLISKKLKKMFKNRL